MTDNPDQILAPAPRTEPISIPGRDPIPVTLLTGFLGSGKTTLLNRILNGNHGLKVGVLVNDFGAINIDAELVEGVEENTINLANGCVCCEIRDDLVKSIEDLLTRERAIDYMILEASGVADPEGIVMTFLNERYRLLLRMDSITCIVDTEAIFEHGDNEALNMLKLRQIGFADLVILNKVDLVGPEHVEVAKDWIDHHINRIRIIEARRCDVPLEILLAVGRFNPAQMILRKIDTTGHIARDGHHNGKGTLNKLFQTWSYVTDKPLSLESLKTMVRRELPASIYRCKGIVFTSEHPEKRLTLQIVGRRTEIYELDDWGDRNPQTQIVAIGEPGGIALLDLDQLFDRCIE